MKAKTIKVGDVGENGATFVHNVLLVDNLNYELLSIHQLCDRNLLILFKKHECLVLDSKFNIIFKEKRFNDVYVVILENINPFNFQFLKFQMKILNCGIESLSFQYVFVNRNFQQGSCWRFAKN